MKSWGVEATKVYEDGKAMLKKIIDNRWLTANGVVMFLPASSIGDDIEIYTDETRTEVAMTWRNLRQQNAKREGIPNKSLADYIAPKFIDGKPSGIEDYIGIFCRHRPASGPRKRKPSSWRSWTITTPLPSRALPTAWPKPLPRPCTSACARTCGLCVRREVQQ